MPDKAPGTISASLIIVILIATAVGALAALFLSGIVTGTRTLALISGFVATIFATIARYKILFLGAGTGGADDAKVPGLVVTYAAIASIAGSLAAHDIFGFMVADGPLAMLGALAGLFSAVLMAMLMITYHTNTRP